MGDARTAGLFELGALDFGRATRRAPQVLPVMTDRPRARITVLSRYWRRGPAATSTTPAECPTTRTHRRRIRPHRCRGIHHHHATLGGTVPVGDRPLHTNHRLAHIRRLPLRDARVRVHDRHRDAPGESGWAWHHLPQVLHKEPRRCQRMPDLRPSPPGPANGEPLAALEFGIRHTGSTR